MTEEADLPRKGSTDVLGVEGVKEIQRSLYRRRVFVEGVDGIESQGRRVTVNGTK